MKNKIYTITIICILNISCTKKNTQYENKSGLKIEVLNDKNLDKNKYNSDNKIYTPGKKFIFSYLYTKNNIDYFCQELSENWDFIYADSIHLYSNVITNISLEIANGNPMLKYIPDYNQTVIKYSYPPFNNYNMTGLVENEKNIWFHPPRKSLFRILELNPFPFIQQPIKIGKEWDWKLKIGDSWKDKRWKLWDGSITNKINYKVEDYIKINTVFGDIDCYVITSNGNSIIGETKLTSYFNEKYGFVKLVYKNIDESIIKLTLISIEDK